MSDTTAGDWLPIEQAPKDGTVVIVWPPSYEGVTSCARWWSCSSDSDEPFWHRQDADEELSRKMPPTHFRPVLKGPQ